MKNNIISIRNLSKSYQNHNVLNCLDWEVQQGNIVALLGKNGAGKSTLLETIMNIRQLENGELKIWGFSWNELPQDKREKIAFVAQEIIGFEWMQVKDFIVYLGSFYPRFKKDYALKLTENWGLDANQKIGNLSKGQKQIVHVIQALSIKPELLILDEPVAHLDPSMRRNFLSEIADLSCENNMTVIFSSHIISDIERIANKVAFIKDKQIKLEHDIENLKSFISTIKITSDHPVTQTDYFLELVKWQTFSHGATAKIVGPLSISLSDFIAGSPYKIEHTPMSLEDWYLEVNDESN
ncbi:ABC transporter ATP-binding protein [Marinicella sp. W31]|uniref:ABC transporter ATP-binding protein n=1 Tax=Marinicella sp. W31 TaxID=3023713 RepID=UPI0037574C73